MILYQQIFFSTLAIAFGLIHLILFLYNRRLRSNLYFALFCFFYSVSIFFDFQILLPTSVSQEFFYLRIHRAIYPFNLIFALLFVYSISESRIPKQFWLISGGMIVASIFAIVEPIKNFNYVQFFFIAILIEAIRIMIAERKRDGAGIVSLGFAFLIVFSSYDSLIDFSVIEAINNIQNGYPFGFVGLILCMSIYLARDFAKTNEKLQEYSQTLEDKVEERTKELKEAQNQLILKEKMASLGNLVAGVAHEVNNPIGAVHSAADITKRCIEKINNILKSNASLEEFKSDQELQKSLKLLEDNNQITTTASERITKIVRSLKTFARLDEADFQNVNIHEGLNSTLTLIEHETRDRISVNKNYGNIPKIDCYPDQLNQVFMNVLMNAVQAIEKMGQITIKTLSKDCKVIINISDSGIGIPSENLDKIFNPGFTTRGVGVGTGLGLSISYNIIQKHNGEIKVESEVGKGTSFTILLPTDLKKLSKTE